MFVGFASRDNSYSLEILISQFKNFIAVKKVFWVLLSICFHHLVSQRKSDFRK